MFGAQLNIQPVQDVVIQQKRAKEVLFCLQVIGQFAHLSPPVEKETRFERFCSDADSDIVEDYVFMVSWGSCEIWG